MSAIQKADLQGIQGFMEGLTLTQLPLLGPFQYNIPGLNLPISSRAKYQLVDHSDKFVKNGTGGRNAVIPTLSDLVATPRIITGAPSTKQSMGISNRVVSINTPIEVAVPFSKFDKSGFFNIDLFKMGDAYKEHKQLQEIFAIAINNNITRAVFSLASTATATSIGSATALPTLDIIRRLKNFAESSSIRNAPEEEGHLFLSNEQLNYMAAVHGFEAVPGTPTRQPHDSLGMRGVQEYETGDIIKPILGTRIYGSNALADGSVSTSTRNLYIKGKDRIGIAFGFVDGFDIYEDKEESMVTFRSQLEFGIFFTDLRKCFQLELIRQPN